MEAFRVGDIIAPHYHLQLLDRGGHADLVLPTDVVVIVGVQGRSWNVTLLLHDSQLRNYVMLDPSPWEIVTTQ